MNLIGSELPISEEKYCSFFGPPDPCLDAPRAAWLAYPDALIIAAPGPPFYDSGESCLRPEALPGCDPDRNEHCGFQLF